jgi:predicted MPP superfamily phosphohydrolase
MSKPKRALLISDVHLDNAEDELLNLVVFKFGKELNPDTIYLNGDIIDNYGVSSYKKHPLNEQTLERDVNATVAFLKKLRKAFPRAEIIYIFGNHEHRLESYITDKAPELFKYVNLEKILELDKLRIKCIRSKHKENYIKRNNLYIGHFDRVSGEAGVTAINLLRAKGVSLIQGHVHRAGMTAKRFLDRTEYAYEVPCLAKMDIEYIKFPNWMHGFMVIYFTEDDHWAYVIPIKENKFVWEGKEWGI